MQGKKQSGLLSSKVGRKLIQDFNFGCDCPGVGLVARTVASWNLFFAIQSYSVKAHFFVALSSILDQHY